jgi:hypothetical protein
MFKQKKKTIIQEKLEPKPFDALEKLKPTNIPSVEEQWRNMDKHQASNPPAKTFNSELERNALELVKLVISKQEKYGKGNINNFGEFGVLVRMNDKFERLKNMVQNNLQDTKEPIDDTLSDIIGYALLWKMLREGTFNLPLIQNDLPIMRSSNWFTVEGCKVYTHEDILGNERKDGGR